MRELLAITGALSDPSRVRLLLALYGREVCVCNLVEFIGLADSTVSKHMSILKQAGLVDSRKCGRWVYYRLASDNPSSLARNAVALVQQHLHRDPSIASDTARIIELLLKHNGNKCQPDEAACREGEPVETAGEL